MSQNDVKRYIIGPKVRKLGWWPMTRILAAKEMQMVATCIIEIITDAGQDG